MSLTSMKLSNLRKAIILTGKLSLVSPVGECTFISNGKTTEHNILDTERSFTRHTDNLYSAAYNLYNYK